jgi:hypothetical protein
MDSGRWAEGGGRRTWLEKHKASRQRKLGGCFMNKMISWKQVLIETYWIILSVKINNFNNSQTCQKIKDCSYSSQCHNTLNKTQGNHYTNATQSPAILYRHQFKISLNDSPGIIRQTSHAEWLNGLVVIETDTCRWPTVCQYIHSLNKENQFSPLSDLTRIGVWLNVQCASKQVAVSYLIEVQINSCLQ